MKKEINPVLIGGIIAAVLVLVLAGIRVWTSPPETPAPSGVDAEIARKEMAKERGGPPPEALKKRDEWNRTHPDAAGSR